MTSTPLIAAVTAGALAVAGAIAVMAVPTQAPVAWTITGAHIADGTGAPLRTGTVRIVGDVIASVGAAAARPGDQVIDGTGLVVAPGFIDVHNHSTDGIATDRAAASQISQGITTVLVGPDGSSPTSIAQYLAARRASPATLNLATMIGHATVRVQVMGEDDRRPGTAAEVARMAALDDVGGSRNIQFTRLARYPQYQGRRLSDAAPAEGISEVEFFIRIADDEVGISGHTMSEPDLQRFYQQPWVMVASDGGVGNSHPRGAGTFPRVLGRLVREQRWMTLPEAIRKMTSLPAQRLGLTDRGRIAPGAKADLVLFDAATIIDRATFDSPREVSQGVRVVWVNGEPVWRDGHATAARPGRVLVNER